MPAIGGTNRVGVQYLDYAAKRQTVTLFVGEITAVSLPGLLTQIGAYKTALDAVTLGTRAAESWGEFTTVSNTPPTDETARVETELLVRCQGATTEQPWSFRIPTVDYAAFNYINGVGGDQVILSGAGASAETTALITAIEAMAKNPLDETEALVVVGMNVVR